jgi:hypothetical protein
MLGADSAVALMELIKYIASDGDLCNVDEYKLEESRQSNDDVLVDIQGESSCKDSDTPCMGRDEITSLDKDVPQLVEEAMNDTFVKPSKKKSEYSRN